MPNSSKKNIRASLLLAATLLPFFSVAIPVFAADLTSSASVSPTTVYSDTGYSVSATISNPNPGPVGVLYYWYKDGVQSSTCYGGSAISANGSTSTSCPGSTGSGGNYRVDVYHSDTSRGWVLLTSASVTVTITARPVSSANISADSTNINYNTSTTIRWSSANVVKDSCKISALGVDQQNSGSQSTGNLTVSKTYTINCDAASGTTGTPTDSVTVNVSPPPKTTPAITWATPSAVAYGTALSGTQLNATASVTGTFSYSPANGTTVYSSQNLSVTFTPTDTTKYNTASASVFLTVNPQPVLPTNSISVQTTLDGGPYSLTISQVGGSPSGMGGTTSGGSSSYYTRSTTDSIDVMLRAPSVSGNYFSGWSGCSSVSGADCRVGVSGGGNRSVVAVYRSPASLPNLTTSITRVVGARSAETGQFLPGGAVYVVATVSNGGGGGINDFYTDFQWSSDGINFAPLPGKYLWNGALTGTPLGAGASKKFSTEFTPAAVDSFIIKACANPSGSGESNSSDNCAQTTITVQTPTPPSPIPTCQAFFNNVISIDSAGAWTTNVSGSIQGCPSERYRSLRVSGGADDYAPVNTTFSHIFDLVSGFYRTMTSNEASAMCSADHQAIEGSSGSNTCSGDLQFGDITGLVGGSPFNALYRNRTFPNTYLFEAQYLPWGNYPFYVDDYFEGEYACTLGGTRTDYHAECDSANVQYTPANCTTAVETQSAIPKDWRSFARPNNPVSTELTLCAEEPANRNQQNENAYFDTQCTPHNPDTASVSIDCGSYTAQDVARIKIPPVTVPNQPSRPIFPPPTNPNGHWLKVQSTRDSVSAPGVAIEQVSVSPATFSANYFAGATNYERFADKNYTVVLRAPTTHPQGGALKAYPDSWTGCDLISPNGRECTVSFAFTTSGRQERTVVANYSGKLDAPAITTSTPQCDAVGGKVNVYLQSAVSGATGYKLYRKSASTAASLVKDFSAVSAPFAANPYTDNTGTPNVTYFYTMTAYNSSANSPASIEVSRAASLPCPDLVVEPNSVEIINTANPPQVLDRTAVPSNTSIKFRAKIRNQNGATDSTIFTNQFTVGTTVLTPHPSLSNLGQGALSSFINSGIWLTPTPTTATSFSLQVCADYPLPGDIDEKNATGNAETNNCLTTPFSFSVVTPITVQLQCEQAGGTFKNDYCVIDYANTSNLRWTVTGNPSICSSSTGTDWTGTKANQSYTVTGNPFSITNLLGKLSFKYQLDCTR